MRSVAAVRTARTRALVLAAAAAMTLVACSSDPDPTASPTGPDEIPGVTAGSASPAPSVEAPTVEAEIGEMAVVASEDVATGLSAPWAIAFEPDGSMLVTERDAGRIVRVGAGGTTTPLTGPGARALEQTDATGEAGLLGLALLPTDPSVLYAYLTRSDGNAVVRMDLDGDSLSAPVDIVAGIPKAANHDGGRIAFGPDDHLYIATGDAAQPELAQDRDTLHGTILRVVADGPDGAEDGAAAPGNPFDDLVWSYGHRNVQGLGWTPDGTMLASEFGQANADELNVIEPGANYGWPLVEGLIGAPEGTELGDTVDGLTYPAAEWRPTAASSPSGIAVTEEGAYVAALRGQAVFRVPFTADGIGEPQVLVDDLGRIRAVEVGPDGALYVLTNNTDGRGEPRDGDDRIVRMEIEPAG
ncbi:PQQ-dependent sugar dehydrogenase [Demequina sp. SO4-18]|uniref:PQQ-dependent sugar dehydrogenase n=1 Tax=Demequina sp. SO4-18 TaxID=3401026 RepID=UPI003B59394A